MTKYVRQELESALTLGSLAVIVIAGGVLAWRAISPSQAPAPTPSGTKPPPPPPLPTNPPPPQPSSLTPARMIYVMVYTYGLDFSTGEEGWNLSMQGWVPSSGFSAASQAAATGGGALYKYVVVYDPSGTLGQGWQGSCLMNTSGQCLGS
jgi:hypothetical protein